MAKLAEQDTALQTDALHKAGCERVFEDMVSGVKADSPGLTAALAYVREGDTFVVWRLDRLGRSLPHLIDLISALEGRRVGFRSITESIDTTTSGGRLIFHVFGTLGQFERDLIRERTKAGLAATHSRAQACRRCREVATGAGAHREGVERSRGRYTPQDR